MRRDLRDLLIVVALAALAGGVAMAQVPVPAPPHEDPCPAARPDCTSTTTLLPVTR